MWLAYQPPHFMSFTILNIYIWIANLLVVSFSCLLRDWNVSCCFCAFQVLLSWIICWLLATRHWVQTQHLDHWGCFRNRGERERERWPSQGHLLLDVLKLWNSERICTSLVSPRTFFFCTHIHTSFPTKPCLNDSYLFWTTKKLLLEQWEKQSKRNYLQWPTPPNS